MNNPITLSIDTSVSGAASVTLALGTETYTVSKVSVGHKAQTLLTLIDEILTGLNLTMQDVTGLHVVTGPGSFTGIRVGIAVVNMLGTLYNLPINGKRTLATPVYS